MADLTRVVEYREGAAGLLALPLLLGLVAMALWLVAFGEDRGRIIGLAWVFIALIAGMFAWRLVRSFADRRPNLSLSPQGLVLRLRGWGALALPWSAVLAVDTRSFDGFALRTRPGRQRTRFSNVTLVRIDPARLADERDAGRFRPSGPSLDWFIRQEPDGTWIALHHEAQGLTPAEVRGPVEARWRAFAGLDASSLPPPAEGMPLRLGGFRPRQPALYWPSLMATVAVVVALLTNIAGMWETAGQIQDRQRAEHWAAQRAAERETFRDLRGEAEERWRAFDQRTQRALSPPPQR